MATIKSSTAERGLALVGVGAMLAAALTVGYFNPTTAGFFPACPFFELTGLACPGCGMTRGLHALLHGDLLTALDFNLLLLPVLFFFGYLFVSLFLTFSRGRGLNFKLFNKTAVIVGFLAFTVVFTVARNLPSYPFNILFP